jgi:hypothetical protein
MLLATHSMLAGKWATVAFGIFGWCRWAVPAITSAAANPELTLAARRQLTVLALVCVIPLLAIAVLIYSASNEVDHLQTYPGKDLAEGADSARLVL